MGAHVVRRSTQAESCAESSKPMAAHALCRQSPGARRSGLTQAIPVLGPATVVGGLDAARSIDVCVVRVGRVGQRPALTKAARPARGAQLVRGLSSKLTGLFEAVRAPAVRG
jgi:hypothetical protein